MNEPAVPDRGDGDRTGPWPPPGAVGMPLDQVDTPALLLDLEAFEDNLERMDRPLRSGREPPRLDPGLPPWPGGDRLAGLGPGGVPLKSYDREGNSAWASIRIPVRLPTFSARARALARLRAPRTFSPRNSRSPS